MSDESTKSDCDFYQDKEHTFSVITECEEVHLQHASKNELCTSKHFDSTSLKNDSIIDSRLASFKFKRRTCLEAGQVSMENISLLSIFRTNVNIKNNTLSLISNHKKSGKDLSTVSMPIALNEPLNLLQKLCEELEYYSLLEQAAISRTNLERIVLVAGFCVSGYASTISRAGRKPFNPMLGETFEYTRLDKGLSFIAEKVCHYPPIMAYIYTCYFMQFI